MTDPKCNSEVPTVLYCTKLQLLSPPHIPHTDSSNKVPIVTELTLEMQGYRLIDSCGPQGISQAVRVVQQTFIRNVNQIETNRYRAMLFDIELIFIDN